MNKYEILFIFDPEADIKALKKKYESILLKDNGKIIASDDWKKLTLAYPIAKKAEGYYYCLIVETNIGNINELNSKINIDKKVLRFFKLNTDNMQHYVVNTKLSQHEIVADHFVKKPYQRFNRYQNKRFNQEVTNEKSEEVGNKGEVKQETKPKQPPTIFYRPEKNPFYIHPKKTYSHNKENFNNRKNVVKKSNPAKVDLQKKDALKHNDKLVKKEIIKSNQSTNKTMKKESHND